MSAPVVSFHGKHFNLETAQYPFSCGMEIKIVWLHLAHLIESVTHLVVFKLFNFVSSSCPVHLPFINKTSKYGIETASNTPSKSVIQSRPWCGIRRGGWFFWWWTAKKESSQLLSFQVLWIVRLIPQLCWLKINLVFWLFS